MWDNYCLINLLHSKYLLPCVSLTLSSCSLDVLSSILLFLTPWVYQFLFLEVLSCSMHCFCVFCEDLHHGNKNPMHSLSRKLPLKLSSVDLGRGHITRTLCTAHLTSSLLVVSLPINSWVLSPAQTSSLQLFLSFFLNYVFVLVTF